MQTPTVLVVDDDAFFRTFCSDVLRQEGYEVELAASGAEALERIEALHPALVLADIYMPEMSGLELLESVKARSPSVDVVIMTGYASIETAIQALKRGAADYLRKPFAAEELAAVVEATVAQRRLYEENARLRFQLELYELGRSFSSVEDPERVLALGLEALGHVTRAQAGLCLYTGDDLAFMPVLKPWRLDTHQAQAVRDAMVTRGLRYLRGLERVRTVGRARLLRILGDGTDLDPAEMLLVPMLHRGSAEGAFILLRDRAASRFEPDDIEKAVFLGRQIELSFEGARNLQEARQLAFIDALTDLYNARYMEEALDRAIAESDRGGQAFSVLFMDLDRFKEINDRHGHLTGGKALIEVSRLLAGNVRENDVVIRYGGDEFVVILPGSGSEEAREVAERIRLAIRQHRFLGREGRHIRLTASIGVATYPTSASSREELIDQADRAMYRGKETTRDAVYLATSP